MLGRVVRQNFMGGRALSKFGGSRRLFASRASTPSDASKTTEASTSPKKEPWYKDGLKFKCTGCGKCCTGASGWVWISDDDINAIAAHLKIPRNKFVEEYTEYVPELQRYSLKERIVQATPMDPDRDTEFECIFLNEKSRCEGLDHPEATVTPASQITETVEFERNSKARLRRARIKI